MYLVHRYIESSLIEKIAFTIEKQAPYNGLKAKISSASIYGSYYMDIWHEDENEDIDMFCSIRIANHPSTHSYRGSKYPVNGDFINETIDDIKDWIMDYFNYEAKRYRINFYLESWRNKPLKLGAKYTDKDVWVKQLPGGSWDFTDQYDKSAIHAIRRYARKGGYPDVFLDDGTKIII